LGISDFGFRISERESVGDGVTVGVGVIVGVAVAVGLIDRVTE